MSMSYYMQLIWGYIYLYIGEGKGFLWVLFAAGFILMILRVRRRPEASYLVWYTIIVSVLMFNPLTGSLLGKVGLDEVYWRMMWLIPITPVIAMAVAGADNYVLDLSKKKPSEKTSKWVRFAIAVVCSIAVVACGKWVYIERDFDFKKNVYKLPDDIPQVGRILKNGSKMIGEDSVMEWIRVYDATIRLPYGRQDLHFTHNDHQEELMQIFHEEVWSAKKVCTAARDNHCKYIVASVDRQIDGAMADYGYEEKTRTEKYIIYKRHKLESKN